MPVAIGFTAETPRTRRMQCEAGSRAGANWTIDPDLLTRLDSFARRHGMTRSHLIAASVEAYLANADRKTGRRIAG